MSQNINNSPDQDKKKNKHLYDRYYDKFGEGFSKKVYSIYNTKMWEQTRQKVYKRDLMTCQHCKCIIRSYPQCHHIEPLNPSNIDDPLKVYGLDNLLLLCVGCHNRVHEPDRKPHATQNIYKPIEEQVGDINLF